MKTTLLIGTCLLTALFALPASAAPVQNLAVIVSQAAVNPIFMEYEGVKGIYAPLEETVALIEEVERPAEFLVELAAADRILIGLLRDSAEANLTEDAAGNQVVDAEGFAASFMRALNNKNPELIRFAAIGWDTTAKRAQTKVAQLAKNPTPEGAKSAIIAILIGMVKAIEADETAMGTANGGVWKTTNMAADAGDYLVWQRTGSGG